MCILCLLSFNDTPCTFFQSVFFLSSLNLRYFYVFLHVFTKWYTLEWATNSIQLNLFISLLIFNMFKYLYLFFVCISIIFTKETVSQATADIVFIYKYINNDNFQIIIIIILFFKIDLLCMNCFYLLFLHDVDWMKCMLHIKGVTVPMSA